MDLSDGCAIIPAAGVGSRLKPHTHTIPKPLLSVGGKPILAHILDEVVALGVPRIVLVVGYRGDQIVDFAQDRYLDCEVIAVQQDKPEGIGQAVYLARDHAEGRPTLIVFGDTVFECDLAPIAGLDVDGAIGVRNVEDPSRFGVADFNEDSGFECFISMSNSLTEKINAKLTRQRICKQISSVGDRIVSDGKG